MGFKPRTLLRGLDSVAWATLEHAYGAAEDVPANLRALLSKSADKRAAAFGHLENSICHQGWASPSAAETVPFLIELACDARVADRARIVRLIGDLSVGGMHTERLDAGDVYRPYGDELQWLDRLRATVTGARARIVVLYGDRDPAVRAAVSLVLAMMGEHAAELIEPVRCAATRERHGAARASAMIALGLLGRNLRSDVDKELFVAAMTGKETIVRIGAAIALSSIESPVRAEAVQLLAQAARDGDRAAKAFPWVGGDVANLASRVLTLRGGASALLDYLISAPPAPRNDPAAIIAQANTARQILALTFPKPLPAGASPADLSESQRRVVTELSNRYLFWDERLAPELGLPKAPEEAREWLGIPAPVQAPTLLDQTLQWQGRFVPVRDVWLATTAAGPRERARLISALHDRFDKPALFGLWLDTHKRTRSWMRGEHAVELQLELLLSLGEAAVELVRAQVAELKQWGPPMARIQNQKGVWLTTVYSNLTGWYGVTLALVAARRNERPDDDAYRCLMDAISGMKVLPQVNDALRAFDDERRIELVLRPHRGDYWHLAPSDKVTKWAHYFLTCIPTVESVRAGKAHFDRYVAALRDAGDEPAATELESAVAARLV